MKKKLIKAIEAKLMNIVKQKIAQRRKSMWLFNARASQLPPRGKWSVWLILAGRGFGKTRTGAETIRHWADHLRYKNIALIGQSTKEAAKVMVQGESGLQNVYPESQQPKLNLSNYQLKLGTDKTATLYSGNRPDQLRGPQFDLAWVDELAKFRDPDAFWDQLMMSLRLGDDPRCVITTTPRPSPLLGKLMQQDDVVVTQGSTFDNEENLSSTFIKQMKQQYVGTKLGAQELFAQVLTECEGALWNREMIHYKSPPENEDGSLKLSRIVIAIDPATTHTDKSDETGIVVAGIDEDNQAYVLEDLSGRLSPATWGDRVVEAFYRWKADRVVAEVNKGGDLVERVIKGQDKTVPFKAVRATRGKATRAEPISALYEQGKVFHARPLQIMEKQICEYVPGVTAKSPDRLDALVWALTELMLVAENRPSLKIWEL